MNGAKILVSMVCSALLFLAAFPNHNIALAEKKKIYLRQADRLEGGQKRSPFGRIEQVRSVSGNVVFSHENFLLHCDKATEFLESNVVELKGNIYMTDRQTEVFCDRAIYYPDTGIAELKNNVRGRMLENDLVTSSERAHIDRQNDRITMYRKAIAWQTERQFSGDSITVQLKKDEEIQRIESITVNGKAFFIARDTLELKRNLYNQLSGKSMRFDMSDREELSGILVEDQAKSLYHSYNTDNTPSGINFVGGKTITMSFSEGKLDRIAVTGNVEGKQYPNRMRGSREINLPGFKLRFDEKPRFSE